MQYLYPYELVADPPGCFIRFPDVPGAQSGDETEEAALAGAEDCLVAALGACVKTRAPIPQPSRPLPGQRMAAVPPLAAIKLALYEAMREKGITNVAIAERLGVSETVVRRLLNLDHRSHIELVERALRLLGKRVAVEVMVA